MDDEKINKILALFIYICETKTLSTLNILSIPGTRIKSSYIKNDNSQ